MSERHYSRSMSRTIGAAAAAGAAATTAMSVFMKGWQQVSRDERARRIPPREVTKGLADKAGMWQRLGPGARTALTWVSHYGFGTTMAAAYAGTAARIPAPRPVTGALFGLGVWAASYAGWAPSLGVLPGPGDKPRERNALLIGAHLVWGSVLGWSLNGLSGSRGD